MKMKMKIIIIWSLCLFNDILHAKILKKKKIERTRNKHRSLNKGEEKDGNLEFIFKELSYEILDSWISDMKKTKGPQRK